MAESSCCTCQCAKVCVCACARTIELVCMLRDPVRDSVFGHMQLPTCGVCVCMCLLVCVCVSVCMFRVSEDVFVHESMFFE